MVERTTTSSFYFVFFSFTGSYIFSGNFPEPIERQGVRLTIALCPVTGQLSGDTNCNCPRLLWSIDGQPFIMSRKTDNNRQLGQRPQSDLNCDWVGVATEGPLHGLISLRASGADEDLIVRLTGTAAKLCTFSVQPEIINLGFKWGNTKTEIRN